MIKIVEDLRDIDIYMELRDEVNWVKLTKEQAKTALDNSVKVFTVFDDERPIGMGRVVGDKAVISYIQDLIIIPEYQSRHIGSMLIEHIIDYVRSLAMDNSRMMLCLMCAKGREQFYEKHNFIARPTDMLGPGMIQYIYADDNCNVNHNTKKVDNASR